MKVMAMMRDPGEEYFDKILLAYRLGVMFKALVSLEL